MSTSGLDALPKFPVVGNTQNANIQKTIATVDNDDRSSSQLGIRVAVEGKLFVYVPSHDEGAVRSEEKVSSHNDTPSKPSGGQVVPPGTGSSTSSSSSTTPDAPKQTGGMRQSDRHGLLENPWAQPERPERNVAHAPDRMPPIIGTKRFEASEWRQRPEIAAKIRAVNEASLAEKTAWSDKYKEGGTYQKRMDAYVTEQTKLDRRILERTIPIEDILPEANRVGMIALAAYGFADEKGNWTPQTVEDCMKAGKLFAWASIYANWLSQVPGALRYATLGGVATGLWKAGGETLPWHTVAMGAGGMEAANRLLAAGKDTPSWMEEVGRFTAQKMNPKVPLLTDFGADPNTAIKLSKFAERSSGVAAGLGAFSVAYTLIQVYLSFYAPLKNADQQTEVGKQQTHQEPIWWPNVQPSKIVGRDGTTFLSDRKELKDRIKRLEGAQTKEAVFEIYAEVGKKIIADIKHAKKKIEKYEENPVKFQKQLESWQRSLASLVKKSESYSGDFKTLTKDDILYDLKVELQTVVAYHNLNAAENQFWGRTSRQVFAATILILQTINTAGGWKHGDPVLNFVLAGLQLLQATVYAYVHGIMGGKDALCRLANVAQIGAICKVGSLGTPEEGVNFKAIDDYGKGPEQLRLDGQKKILTYNAEACLCAAQAHVANAEGKLPGSWTKDILEKQLKACNSAEERKAVFLKMCNQGDWPKRPNPTPEAVSLGLRCLELHEEALSDIALFEEAIRTGDTRRIFSVECHMTKEDQELLLDAMLFAKGRLDPSLPGGDGTRAPEDPKLEEADLKFAARIGRCDGNDYVASMHQGIAKLGDNWLGWIYGGAAPGLVQAGLSLSQGLIYFGQAGVGKVPSEPGQVFGWTGAFLGGWGLWWGSFLARTSRIGYGLKNDFRMRDKDATLTLPGMGILKDTFPYNPRFIPLFGIPEPTVMDRFETLGGTAPPVRPGMKLKVQPPQQGVHDFKAYQNSMGGLNPRGIWKVATKHLEGGKLDEEALRNIPNKEKLAEQMFAIANLRKIKNEKLPLDQLASKFITALAQVDKGIRELAGTDKDLATEAGAERDLVVLEFWSHHFNTERTQGQRPSMEQLRDSVTEARKLAAVQGPHLYRLQHQVLPMLVDQAKTLGQYASTAAENDGVEEINAAIQTLCEDLGVEAEDSSPAKVIELDKKAPWSAEEILDYIEEQKLFARMASVWNRPQLARDLLEERLGLIASKIAEFEDRLTRTNPSDLTTLQLRETQSFETLNKKYKELKVLWFDIKEPKPSAPVVDVQGMFLRAEQSQMDGAEADGSGLEVLVNDVAHDIDQVISLIEGKDPDSDSETVVLDRSESESDTPPPSGPATPRLDAKAMEKEILALMKDFQSITPMPKGAVPIGPSFAEKYAADRGWKVEDNGDGLNCLITSLAQHAKKDYAGKHDEDVKAIRSALRNGFATALAKQVNAKAECPAFEAVIDIVNRHFKTQMKVDVIVPEEDGSAATLAFAGKGTDKVTLIAGRGGARTLNAVHQQPSVDEIRRAIEIQNIGVRIAFAKSDSRAYERLKANLSEIAESIRQLPQRLQHAPIAAHQNLIRLTERLKDFPTAKEAPRLNVFDAVLYDLAAEFPALEDAKSDDANVRSQLGAYKDNTGVAQDAITGMQRKVHVNNGDDGLDSLIHALVQHATKVYGDDHGKIAAKLREKLEAKLVALFGKSLEQLRLPTGIAIFDMAVAAVNEEFGTRMTVEVLAPGPDGVVGARIDHSRDISNKVTLLLGRDGRKRFDAVAPTTIAKAEPATVPLSPVGLTGEAIAAATELNAVALSRHMQTLPDQSTRRAQASQLMHMMIDVLEGKTQADIDTTMIAQLTKCAGLLKGFGGDPGGRMGGNSFKDRLLALATAGANLSATMPAKQKAWEDCSKFARGLPGGEGRRPAKGPQATRGTQPSIATATTTATETATTPTKDTASTMPVNPAETAQAKPASVAPLAGYAIQAANDLNVDRLRNYMEVYLQRQTAETRAAHANQLMHLMLDAVGKNLAATGAGGVDRLSQCTDYLIKAGGDPRFVNANGTSFSDRLLALATEGAAVSTMQKVDEKAWQDCGEFARGLMSTGTTADKTSTGPAKTTAGTSNPATGSQRPQASSGQPQPASQVVTPSVVKTGHGELDDDALDAARNWDHAKLRDYMEKQAPDLQPTRANQLMHVMLDSLDKNMTAVGIASIGKLKACTLLLVRYGGNPSSVDTKGTPFMSRLADLATQGSNLPLQGPEDTEAWQDCIEFAERLGK